MQIRYHFHAAIIMAAWFAMWPAVRISSQSIDRLWQCPPKDYRMKTWWFFGYGPTTAEGISADARSLSEAGFGGVVYYDQNHARNPEANGAEPGFSASWWAHLRHAAAEAQRHGLDFEMNISNGYVAGGSWISPRHAMQRVASAESLVVSDGVSPVVIPIPRITGRENYVFDIICLAMPCSADGKMRHITALYRPSGKGRTGAMQRPQEGTSGDFQGYGFIERPDIGVLQASDDSVTWRDILPLRHMYSSQGGYPVRTNSFPAHSARYWRILYNGKDTLRSWHLGSAAKMDRWEELAGLHSDFRDTFCTPDYDSQEVIAASDIINVSDSIQADTLRCLLPKGQWSILRMAAVLTGAKSKHGRTNLIGYECDKLSAEAANHHWDSYIQVIIDSLRAAGIDNLVGVTMDSHEGGSQNWTPLMLHEFQRRRGYDLTPYLPILAGYIIDSKEKTDQVLYDYRKTISDCMTDNYFATFQSRASQNGLRFTAQAIGNALCIPGDAIAVKRVVDRPQGEFWTYQKEGAYDVKDCSSAAHLYGKPVASAEAMTDAEYKHDASDLKRVADIAFSFGAQEMVICATPHIPEVNPEAPYVAGREYAINRSNPRWPSFKPVWQAAARSMVMLRQGEACPDVLVYMGDDVPIKTLSHLLPDGLSGLDWDVCSGDALRHSSDYILKTYKALVIAKGVHISDSVSHEIARLKAAGMPVLYSARSVSRPIAVSSDAVVHTHRRFAYRGKQTELFFLANKEKVPVTVKVNFEQLPRKVKLWHTATGRRKTIKPYSQGQYTITLSGNESVFVTF
ncbi:MAG: glycosyl hydrolase [Prevotella sp.]